MAEQRLSKLQKWILLKCYELREYRLWRSYLVRLYRQEFEISKMNSIQVSITRSMRTLAKKEYIFVHGSKEKPFIDITHVLSRGQRIARNVAANIKFLRLTDGGVAKAEELLNVKK